MKSIRKVYKSTKTLFFSVMVEFKKRRWNLAFCKLKSADNHTFILSLIIITFLVGVYIFSLTLEKREFDNTLSEDYKCKDCNVIIISVTNLRNDHLGYNGYFRDTSPNIDSLAAESIIFENAFSQASWTLPVGMSLFTSLYPLNHEVMNRYSGVTNLSKDIISLPEILKNNGYVTAAFTGGFDYSDKFGLMQRFDTLVYSGEGKGLQYGNFGENLFHVTEWLNTHKDDKFMLFYHGFDVHCPFAFPVENNVFDKNYQGDINFSDCLWTFDKVDPIIIRNTTYYNVKTPFKEGKGFASVQLDEKDINHMVALYDGEIKIVDNTLGKFFDEIMKLNLEKNTIILLLSEHGDLFGEHGRFMRGGPLRGTFYDEVLHVPLIIRHPKLDPKKVDGLVQIVDIMPTLLEFLDISREKHFEGKSIVPLIVNNTKVNDFVYAGSKYTPLENNPFFNVSSFIQAVRTKEFKLINEKLFDLSGSMIVDSYEFYNLSSDPLELNNIYLVADPNLISEFEEKMEKYLG